METATLGYPVELDLQAPPEVPRWRPLVNWLLAIPQFLISNVLTRLRYVLLLISFFAVLFTKAIPKSLFDMIVMTYRYEWRVTTFGLWMREKYPPFSFTPAAQDDGIDPAFVSVRYPSELNRWMPLVKWLLAFPHYVALVFVWIGTIFVIIASFFAVLFTGRYPQGMQNFVVGSARWTQRVKAYAGLLTDEYPPFSLH
jgi:uncharacterized protein DUF4389